MKDNKDKFEVIATKIDPAMSEVLNACCDALQVDVYHLLQWFLYHHQSFSTDARTGPTHSEVAHPVGM